MDLRNFGILPQHYTASQPRRPRLEVSLERYPTPGIYLIPTELIQVDAMISYSGSHKVNNLWFLFIVIKY